jgi:hypothetical protein
MFRERVINRQYFSRQSREILNLRFFDIQPRRLATLELHGVENQIPGDAVFGIKADLVNLFSNR